MESYAVSEVLERGVLLLNRDVGTCYTLERLVGQGNFGQVWRAVDTEGALFALKVQARAIAFNHTCDDEQLRDVLAAECAKCKDLSVRLHAFVPQFYEAFCVDRQSFKSNSRVGLHVVVMEFIDGISLDKLVGMVPFQEAVAAFILRTLCEALQQLHSFHLIHRDVKAENVMISREGHVYLCDLGLFKQLPGCVGTRGTICGTPLFMAPELVRSEDYDVKVDVWSVGITAIQLLTGSTPLQKIPVGQNVPQLILHKVIVEAAPRLRGNGVSRDARSFVAMCLEKSPEKRASLNDLLRTRFLHDCQQGRLLLQTLMRRLPTDAF